MNIRFTLRKLRRLGLLEPGDRTSCRAAMKSLHFSARTRDELRRHTASVAGDEAAERIANCYNRKCVDVKRADARALIKAIMRVASEQRPLHRWRFPATGHWQKQFEREIADVPPLQ